MAEPMKAWKIGLDWLVSIKGDFWDTYNIDTFLAKQNMDGFGPH